jgi:hypothetical protein
VKVERSVASTKLSMPHTGRMIVIGGASSGGGTSPSGSRQRTMAMAMLPRWKAMASPQNADAAQSANVIGRR